MEQDQNITLLTGGHGLLEAARWYPEHGLLFSDMLLGGVRRLQDREATPDVLVPRRKAVGGLVAHAEGGLVIAGRDVTHTLLDGQATCLLATGPDEQFFNDLTADARGRVFVGSVARQDSEGVERPGRLYQLDLDGRATVIADDVLISNGLAADPTDRWLYHVDSGRRCVWRFVLAPDGPARDRELFVDTSDDAGVPDGLAVAADGSVWVAMAGGGVVAGWDSAGTRIGEIAVPASMVTSLCFGGEALTTLFVLTGTNAEYPDPRGGMAFRTPAPRTGLPGPLARVTVESPAT